MNKRQKEKQLSKYFREINDLRIHNLKAAIQAIGKTEFSSISGINNLHPYLSGKIEIDSNINSLCNDISIWHQYFRKNITIKNYVARR